VTYKTLQQQKSAKTESINLLSFKPPYMRAFHITWFTFFVCFFGWFGIAPLMPVIRNEFGLSKSQVGNIVIASVAITIFARLAVGWLCDKIGPRITYCMVLITGAIPLMTIGLSHSYESFLLFRLVIGVLGASFVITQYHTSVMFAPKVVGTANAITAGWGNLGGGVTQMLMPLVFAGFVGLGYADAQAWRLSMVVPGIVLLLAAIIYYFYTQDTPEGNFSSFKKNSKLKRERERPGYGFLEICKDYRVWILFFAYGASFGIEITIDNIAAIYFTDNFKLGLKEAGLIAGTFGCMNLFARALGGILGDKAGSRFGFKGRIGTLSICLLMEGIGVMLFSRMTVLPVAIATMLLFALFLKMSNGATYSVVPFINKKSLGTVSGIVGAGGNVGAVLAGFAFKANAISYRDALFFIGIAVIIISIIVSFWLMFESKKDKAEEIQKMILIEMNESALRQTCE
jgi:NNP family nitrate/nitrite transporter-like MFS transporter